eukprot:7998526-Pyramimonas_sp.AAC.1
MCCIAIGWDSCPQLPRQLSNNGSVQSSTVNSQLESEMSESTRSKAPHTSDHCTATIIPGDNKEWHLWHHGQVLKRPSPSRH